MWKPLGNVILYHAICYDREIEKVYQSDGMTYHIQPAVCEGDVGYALVVEDHLRMREWVAEFYRAGEYVPLVIDGNIHVNAVKAARNAVADPGSLPCGAWSLYGDSYYVLWTCRSPDPLCFINDYDGTAYLLPACFSANGVFRVGYAAVVVMSCDELLALMFQEPLERHKLTDSHPEYARQLRLLTDEIGEDDASLLFRECVDALTNNYSVNWKVFLNNVPKGGSRYVHHF